VRPLDIVVVLPSLEQGGAERVAVNHLAGLILAGDRVRLVLTGDGDGSLRAALDPAVAVTVLGRRRGRDAIAALLRHLRHDPPDVLLSTHTHLNLALCAVRRLLPRATRLVVREPTHAPVVLDGRPTRTRRVAQRLLYRRADLVLATSSVMHDDLRRLVGDRVRLVANPVQVDEVRAGVVAAPVPRRAAGRRFITVGRLDTLKSLPELVRAFAAGSDPDDELVIVGDGPTRDAVVASARHAGVAGQVRLTGRLAAPWAEVAASDAFLLASRAEGMPNAVLESLAVGTPVIATDELAVLDDVRSAAPDGAVRLVPRDALGSAVRDVRRTPDAPGAALRASLLPERFTAGVATRALRELLMTLVGAPDGT
jgi:glycosyltransferase involved in cell wall biosynthesis